MSGISHSQTQIGCLIVRSVAGEYGKGYQREVEDYLTHNGAEWTSTRMKAIWNAALHLKNGDKGKAVEIYRSHSISYRRQTGIPKGNIGKCVRAFVESERPSRLRRWAGVLRYYTSLTLSKPSEHQVKKARLSITGKSTAKRLVVEDEIIRFLNRQRPWKSKGLSFRESERFANRMNTGTAYYSPIQIPRGLRELSHGKMMWSFSTTEWIPPAIDHLVPAKELRDSLRNQGLHDSYVGKVAVLQESGCKARVIAIPSAWLQLAFLPLHGAVARFTQDVFRQESCVEDQLKGVEFCKEYGKVGKPLFSVDLESATDRLPVSFQAKLLQSLGAQHYAEALLDVCSREFISPDLGGPVQYSVGQPMGLYGSFPLLNLTNCVVCQVSCTAAREIDPSGDHQFRVLGDDVVFTSEQSALCYRKIMSDLGVNISKAKSFDGKVAEFAGFVMIPSSGPEGYTVFRPYKFSGSKEHISNPLEFLHAFGIHTLRVSDKWLQPFAAFSATVGLRDSALSPLIHEDESQASASSHGGDTRWTNSLFNRICWTLHDMPIPDVNPRFTELPLFYEQGIDLPTQGFDLNSLIRREIPEHVPNPVKQVKKDPLIREFDKNPDKPSIIARLRESNERRIKDRNHRSVPSRKPRPTRHGSER